MKSEVPKLYLKEPCPHFNVCLYEYAYRFSIYVAGMKVSSLVRRPLMEGPGTLCLCTPYFPGKHWELRYRIVYCPYNQRLSVLVSLFVLTSTDIHNWLNKWTFADAGER